MIFEYDELRECVREDFETFYKEMKFTSVQIIPAVLNEYEHGEGFDITEKICIYLFLAEIYRDEELETSEVKKMLYELLSEENIQVLKEVLSENYIQFELDLEKIN